MWKDRIRELGFESYGTFSLGSQEQGAEPNRETEKLAREHKGTSELTCSEMTERS